jgi:putative PIN family toxin of toxin-antitoxin system
VRAILDTNVVISGIFFGGVPQAVLEAWAEGRFELYLTPLIFDECVRTCDRLAETYPGLESNEALATLVGNGTLVADSDETAEITVDPDDDKFMACAKNCAGIVVSGDQHLLDATGWEGVEVLNPRDFLARLSAKSAQPPNDLGFCCTSKDANREA